jgi:hypothetical protein
MRKIFLPGPLRTPGQDASPDSKPQALDTATIRWPSVLAPVKLRDALYSMNNKAVD